MIELESIEDFDRHLDQHGTLGGVALQGIDLCDRTDALMDIDVEGAVFMGCVVEARALRRLHGAGALVFPRFPALPFRAFRAQLYTAEELFAGYVEGRHETLNDAFDTRVHRWYDAHRGNHAVVDALAQRIHDHAIDDALDQLLSLPAERRSRVVAVMGGHGMGRDEDDYAAVARLSHTLTRRGFLCASGGGPGAMEATNLGAWMAPHPGRALDDAVRVLAGASTFEPTGAWLDAAFEVRRRWPRPPGQGESLGVPTWHYGHEPPNVFASHIAKYFANSIREDGLLAIALAGVVFAPGSAGTIQEIFQDAAQNHYRSFGVVSPMVFLGSAFWTEEAPVYPLLARLASGRDYASKLALLDEVDAIVDHLEATAPRLPAPRPERDR